MACQKSVLEVVSLLLNDPRIDINNPENDQCTPLWMASGREVDTKAKSINGPALWNGKTAAEHARFQGIRTMDEGEPEEGDTRRKKNGLLIADLLDSFEADPDVTI